MLEPLKKIFRSYELRKLASAEPTGLFPLSQMTSVTVVMDREDEDLEAAGRQLEKFFADNGLAVTFFIIDMVRRKDDRSMLDQLTEFPSSTVISYKKLNWFGMPKLKYFRIPLFTHTDLFVNLSVKTDFPSAFISAVSPAMMKIGVVAYPGHPFDLVMAEPVDAAEQSEPVESAEPEGVAEPVQVFGAKSGLVRNRRTAEKVENIIRFLKQII